MENIRTSADHSRTIDYAGDDLELRAAFDEQNFKNEDDWRLPGVRRETAACFCIVRYLACLERFEIPLDGEAPDRPSTLVPMPEDRWQHLASIGDADYTYFACGKLTGMIKIGRSKNPDVRIDSLRYTFEPSKPLLVIRDGGLEHGYHELFKRWRVAGEWFAPHPSIRAEIARLKSEGRAEHV